MKTILKIAVVISAVAMMVPEANALFGVRRRTAVVVSCATHDADMAQMQAQQQQQAAAAAAAKPPTPAPAPAPAPANAALPAAATSPAPPAVAAGKPLPVGTVVPALPPGCISTPVGGVEYYYGGGNFYRAVFQGNNLVYVTAQPQ